MPALLLSLTICIWLWFSRRDARRFAHRTDAALAKALARQNDLAGRNAALHRALNACTEAQADNPRTVVSHMHTYQWKPYGTIFKN